MFLNSAGEEKSERKSVVSKCASDDIDEIRHHRSIIALVESINDDDHMRGRH
jgi:hypothetical protein